MGMSISLLFMVVLGAWFTRPQNQRKGISAREAHEMINRDSSVVLLDVRTHEEFNGELGHIRNSILIPVQELHERVGELEQYKGRTIIAVCRSGNRSGKAAAFLTQQGFEAINLEGGMLHWNDEGLPTVRK